MEMNLQMFAASFKDDIYQKDRSDSPAHRIIQDNNIVTASSYDQGWFVTQ